MNKALEALKQLKDFVLEFVKNDLDKIFIYDKKENIEDKYSLSQIPEELFSREVIDWDYGEGKLFIII